MGHLKMVECRIIVNDPKTGKSYQKAFPEGALTGKKIGNKVAGEILGFEDYEFEITGGSDSSGFPMLKNIEGQGKKKVLFSKGPGAHITQKGLVLRKTAHGNTISNTAAQVNLKIVKQGKKSVEEVLGLKKEEQAEPQKEEKKD